MNYLKQYIKLIKKAESRIIMPEAYMEKHHTFPKSIFGKNKRIVKLTRKEHIVAHHLLFLAFEKRYGLTDRKTSKMGYALLAMLGGSTYKNKKLLINLIARIKEKKVLSGANNPMYGRNHTQESIDKIRKHRGSVFGADNPNYKGKVYSWINTKTGVKEILTVLEMELKYPYLQRSNLYKLVSGTYKQHKEWVISSKVA